MQLLLPVTTSFPIAEIQSIVRRLSIFFLAHPLFCQFWCPLESCPSPIVSPISIPLSDLDVGIIVQFHSARTRCCRERSGTGSFYLPGREEGARSYSSIRYLTLIFLGLCRAFPTYKVTPVVGFYFPSNFILSSVFGSAALLLELAAFPRSIDVSVSGSFCGARLPPRDSLRNTFFSQSPLSSHFASSPLPSRSSLDVNKPHFLTRSEPSKKMADNGPSATGQLPPPPQSNAGAPGYENGQNPSSNPSHLPPPPLHIPQNTNPIPTAITSPMGGNGDKSGIISPGSAGPFARRAAPEPNKRALYVGGLDPRVTEDVLRQIFETTGHVQNVKIIPDKNVSEPNPVHFSIYILYCRRPVFFFGLPDIVCQYERLLHQTSRSHDVPIVLTHLFVT